MCSSAHHTKLSTKLSTTISTGLCTGLSTGLGPSDHRFNPSNPRTHYQENDRGPLPGLCLEHRDALRGAEFLVANDLSGGHRSPTSRGRPGPPSGRRDLLASEPGGNPLSPTRYSVRAASILSQNPYTSRSGPASEQSCQHIQPRTRWRPPDPGSHARTLTPKRVSSS
jgi:hypothetical protein